MVDPVHRRPAWLVRDEVADQLSGEALTPADTIRFIEQVARWPDMAFTARANRAFLGRAVRYLLHAMPDADDPHGIVARLMGAVPSGTSPSPM